jgi:predicted dithiol-disulfide oxidoreductase (DUF899 family)
MKTPPIVSRQEWEAVRQQLLVKEKALTRARDTLAAERRRMPWLAVERKYEFDGTEGKASLLDLFDDRRQLIVYRAFFEPGVSGWPDHACIGCSMVADQVAHPAHLNVRDTTLAFVSRASLQAQSWRSGLHPGLTGSGGCAGFPNDRHSFYARRDLFEQLRPFRRRAVLIQSKPGRVAAWVSQALDKARADRVGDHREYDRHSAGGLLQRHDRVVATGQNDVRAECNQLRHVFASALGLAGAPAHVDSHIVAVGPAQFLQALEKCCQTRLSVRTVRGHTHKHAHATHAFGLLRARRNRPRGRCAGQQRDELASPEVEHGLLPGTRCASLPQTQDALVAPACLWGKTESF